MKDEGKILSVGRWTESSRIFACRRSTKAGNRANFFWNLILFRMTARHQMKIVEGRLNEYNEVE